MTQGERPERETMPRADCGQLREATEGVSVIVLAATETEAAVVRDALVGARRLTVATKTVYVGEIARSVEGARQRVALGATGRPTPAGPPGERVALAISGCDKVNAAVTLTCVLQAMAVRPRLVIQAGIAGAFAAEDAGGAVRPAVGGDLAGAQSGPRPGDLVIATQEAYSDTGSTSPDGWISAKELGLPIAEVDGVESGGIFPADPALVAWAVEALASAGFDQAPGAGEHRGGPLLWQGACVTSSTVTGRDDEARAIADRWGALAESMEGAAAAHVCALFGVPFLEVRGISNMVGDRDRADWVVDEAAAVAGRAVLALCGVELPERWG